MLGLMVAREIILLLVLILLPGAEVAFMDAVWCAAEKYGCSLESLPCFYAGSGSSSNGSTC